MGSLDENHNNSGQPKNNQIQIAIPEQVKYLDFDKERKYWRHNLKLTLAPLLICGFPIHIFFVNGIGKGYSKKPQANSIMEWLCCLLKISKSRPALGFVNALFFTIAIYVNLRFAQCIYNAVEALLIEGELRHQVLISILKAIKAILMVVGVTGAWIFGHRFRSLLTSLGQIQPPEQIPYKLMPVVRLRLGFLYLAITAIHVVHAYMFIAQRVKKQSFKTWYITAWAAYIQEPLLATLFFPIYCNVAWNLCRHCTLLRAYLRNTSASADEVLPAFKQYFKELSTCYQSITALFAPYFSWAILVHLFSLSEELTDFDYVVENVNVNEFPLPPTLVRALVALLLLLSLKMFIVVYIVLVASMANTEARYLCVALDDFMAREEQKYVSTDTYQAYRVLKYYVESRLTDAKPCILYIPMISGIGQISRTSLVSIFLTFMQISLFVTYISRDDEEKKSFGGFFRGILGKFGNVTRQ